MSFKIERRAYVDMFGPTTGDKVRLADTDLFIEVEKDFTTYGEEVKFGGGKVIRDGMGQSQVTRAGGAIPASPGCARGGRPIRTAPPRCGGHGPDRGHRLARQP